MNTSPFTEAKTSDAQVSTTDAQKRSASKYVVAKYLNDLSTADEMLKMLGLKE